MFCNKLIWKILQQRVVLIAPLLAFCLLLLFPATSEAHALLIKADPTQDSLLLHTPAQVRLWFSEGLNPDLSTARVESSSNQRVDLQDAHLATSDNTEIDLSLKPNLPPATYVVIWRSHSAADGHIASGSYIFKIALPNGNPPQDSVQVPGQNQSSSTLTNGLLDGSTLTTFLTVTLIDLGAIFWVGAQLWRTFVLQLLETADEEQRSILAHTEQRFDRLLSLPLLLLMLLANIGVLIGQALSATSGDFGQPLSLSLLIELASNGRFGTYWTMREIALLLGIVVGLCALLIRQPSSLMKSIFSWFNLLLGLTLLISLALSGHAAAVGNDLLLFSVLIDWLHLLGASLWIGGMIYLAIAYLPALQHTPLMLATRSLLSVLPRYSPLALIGVLIIVASGPFNAVVHITSLDLLLNTAYGRTLIVKVALVGAVLLTSAIHVGIFRPRLAKTYTHYTSLLNEQAVMTENGSASPIGPTAGEIKQLEQAIVQQTRRLRATLRWEPLLGVAILLCTGLLNAFAGTLTPAIPSQTTPKTTPATAFTTTIQTSDKHYSTTISVSPNKFGTNVFTVTVLDSTGKLDSNVGVSIYLTMLDMDMGTQSYALQPDGKGHFTATGDLAMSGHWGLRITVRTPDNTQHDATLKLLTPY